MDEVREPTAQETEFLGPLLRNLPELQDWYHNDVDGAPWLMVSYDFVSDRGITVTLRLDYDGRTLEGGLSPASLNWDAETRARDVPIDTSEPDGLFYRPTSIADAVVHARVWLLERIAAGLGRA
ncbi:MAG: hypothetical protein JWR83_743 [Aeromicrobium sp.]|nr:hypothetical protein [Aeromicrobium sp.]